MKNYNFLKVGMFFFVLLCFNSSLSAQVVTGPFDGFPPGLANGDSNIIGVRLRRFGNQPNTQQIFSGYRVGIAGANRLESANTWKNNANSASDVTNDFSIVYVPGSDELVVTVEGVAYTYANFETNYATFGNPAYTIDELNYLSISLRASQRSGTNNTVEVTNLTINGVAQPDLSFTSGGGPGAQFFLLEDVNFGTGFNIVGTLELPGPNYGNTDEGHRVELSVGVDEDSPLFRPALIPTMGEWALIFMGLVLITLFSVFVSVPSVSLASVNGSVSHSFKSLPFDGKAYLNSWLQVVCAILILFSIAIIGFGYELTSADPMGATLCSL